MKIRKFLAKAWLGVGVALMATSVVGSLFYLVATCLFFSWQEWVGVFIIMVVSAVITTITMFALEEVGK